MGRPQKRREQITNSVRRSGDLHASMVTRELLSSHKTAARPYVKIVSAHSAATYAPCPFANGHARFASGAEPRQLHDASEAAHDEGGN
jgi:hypothetical protein